jgi:hypothetical protein
LTIGALFLVVPKEGWIAAVAITYASYVLMAGVTSIGLYRAWSGQST